MTCECQGRRSPPAGPGTGRPASRLSLLVGLAESFSSTLAAPAAEGSSSRSPTARSPRSFDYEGAVGLGIVATARSPRSFDYEGAVGLGIVAAMNGRTPHPQTGGTAISRTPRTTVAPRRSQPIPIVSARPDAFGVRRKDRRLDEEEEEMEMSESYTCVISHVGGGAVSKRVYFDDGAGDPSGCCPEVFFDSPPPRPALLPAAGDFLSRCFRCSKDLHDVDIFMYRGDKAFCSAECRCQQIISDEQRGNWLPDGLKTFDCSVSPCSAPLLFAAGVAAA